MRSAKGKTTARLLRGFSAFGKDTSGATAIEYGLIVALIFLAIVGAIRSYTQSTSDMYNEVTTTLGDASS